MKALSPHGTTLASLPPDATAQLLAVVEQLSSLRDMDSLVDYVRRAARRLTGADGATFVLREDDKCFYVDEDAIGPLWKGKRFPLETCVSGWAMQHREAAIIPDVFADPRVPIDAYAPTFVRSLVMVPIRKRAPIGAIGNYWSTKRQPSDEQVRILGALADSVAIAFENVQLYEQLERRVRDRTQQLEDANQQLEAFAYAVSHELKTPLNHILGFAQIVGDSPMLPEPLKRHVVNIENGAQRLDRLVVAMLGAAQTSSRTVVREPIDLGAMALEIATERNPDGHATVVIAPGLHAIGDRALVRVVLENLVGNALKYSRDVAAPHVEVGVEPSRGPAVYFVCDNGIGFDDTSPKLFQPFSRFAPDAAEGTGIGLSTTKHLVQKHGGRIWAESTPGRGTTIRFTLEEA